MEEMIFRIPPEIPEPKLLPVGGRDLEGNEYGADTRSLLLNGKRFFPVMGELHYSRLPKDEWKQELLKMRSGGVDIVGTYVFWNHHEERPGEWDFTGSRDLRAFLTVCKELDQKVWLRIGPWAHGEARHGGFPDYVQYAKDFTPRTDDPKYLELVRILYGKIGEQAEGMMAKDGGPVIGIQLENEYGHCGGPEDREEQKRHMKTLYRLAREAGLIAPYYSATAWGGACTIDETLQVLAGYVDAPWDDSTKELPAMENYLFVPYRDDANTGSDFHRWQEPSGTVRMDQPYLTAELGGGLQPTSHRRPVASGKDNAAHILSVMGSGASLIGYYMYHGGINPEGKYSTLNEAQEIGGNTTVPVKSYDFGACIGESGRVSESFGALKKLHHLIHSYGEALAACICVLPDRLPESAEDMHTLRVALRWDPEKKNGFLFVNNYVRHRVMDGHEDVTIRILLPEGEEITLSGLSFESGGTYLIPVRREENGALLPACGLSLLGKLGKRVFLYADGSERQRELKEKLNAEDSFVTVLSEDEADRSFFLPDGVYIVPDKESLILTEKTESGACRHTLLTEKGGALLKIGEDGKRCEIPVSLPQDMISEKPSFSLACEARDPEGKLLFREYELTLPKTDPRAAETYLRADYLGDRAELYIGGKLAADWFTTGNPWLLKLSRYQFPEKARIRVYDSRNTIPCRFGQEVYYEYPLEEGCGLTALSYVQVAAFSEGIFV